MCMEIFSGIYHLLEVDFVTSFFHLLYSIRLRQGGKDKINWISSNWIR
jgi:hypothetical protein